MSSGLAVTSPSTPLRQYTLLTEEMNHRQSSNKAAKLVKK